MSVSRGGCGGNEVAVINSSVYLGHIVSCSGSSSPKVLDA